MAKNIVFIEKLDTLVSKRQKAEITAAIEAHNASLFDANDYVEPEVEYGADYTCIGSEDAGYYGEQCGKGRESIALTKLYSAIVNILEPQPWEAMEE